LPTTSIVNVTVTVTVVVDRRPSTASSLYHTKLVASLSVVTICPSP
jgi:hypothetical protein